MIKYFFIALMFFSSIIYGQNINISFEKVKQLDGNFVSVITQDNNGFIWLGTQDGLIRYDGNNIDKLRYSPENSNSIPANWIKDMVLDKDQVFYLGTQGGGLSKMSIYDMKFFNSVDEPIGLLIKQIELLSNGILVVESQNGIFLGNKNGYEKLPFSSYLRYLGFQGENIWLSSENELVLFNTNTKETVLTETFSSRIESIVSITNNSFLVSTYNGLYEYQKNTKPIKITTDGFFLGGINYNKDLIFLYTNSSLFEFSVKTNTIKKINFENNFPNIKIITLFKDRQDILWIGTDKGLLKEKKKLPAFHNNNIFIRLTRQITAHNNKLFLGGEKGLFVVDANNNINQLSNMSFGSLSIIDDNVWAGGANGNFYIIDDSFKSTNHQLEDYYAEGHAIYGFNEDSNNRVWVSTWRGIYALNKKGEVLKNFQINNVYPKVLQSYIDSKDRLWLASVDYGIFLINKISNFDLKGESISATHFQYEKDNFNSLTSNLVMAINEDLDGTLWFGTDAGIVSYNESTNDFKRLRVTNSLFDKKVMSIEHDSNNSLWISTINDGLFKYRKIDNSLNNFTTIDGLISNSFLYTSGEYDNKSGKLYFGAENGVQIIQPELLDNSSSLFKPKITRFDFTGETVNNIHPFQTPYLKKIKLKYTQNDFVVHFSSLDFINSEKLKYSYKLDNFGWKTTTLPYVYFTNISDGKHQLKIKTQLDDNVVSSNNNEIETLNIEVIPPWYRSFLSYLIYGILVIALVYYIVNLVIRRKIAIAQTKSVKALDALKSKMYANISHEIKTPITVINGLSNLILKEEINDVNQKNIKGILKSSNQLLNLVNQMLELVSIDANKVEVNYKSGNVIAFIEQCVELYQPLAEAKGQQLTFKSNCTELIMDIDDDKLQKILNNLISNALKFTPNTGSIFVDMLQKDKTLTIKVSDTGKGISKKEIPLVFDRYYKTFDQSNSLGSGIGMAITKELINLLKGTISVDSEVDKGTIFTIQLPITNTVNDSKNLIFKDVFLEENTLANTEKPFTIKSEFSILVVEDNLDVSSYIERLLSPIYNITIASNGKEALKILKDASFDLIISDLHMPEMDGYEFCKHLKKDIDTSHIPLVILSAKSEAKDKIEGYKIGIDSFLTKPFNAEELLIILRKLIEKRQDQINYFNKLLSLKKTSKEGLNLNQLDIDLVKKLQEIILDKTETTSIEMLTKKLSISKSKLHRKVKALTGMSVSHYVNHIKIEKAIDLLKETNLNINEIAFEVGYDDPTYFSRVFKNSQNVSPDQFRKNLNPSK